MDLKEAVPYCTQTIRLVCWLHSAKLRTQLVATAFQPVIMPGGLASYGAMVTSLNLSQRFRSQNGQLLARDACG